MSLEDAKSWGQLAAWVSAAAFFLFKLGSGYLIGSTSLRLSCVRSKSTAEKDYVSVVAIVKRGSGSTLVLHDVKARVTYAGGIPDFRSLPESERLPASAETETRLASAVRLRSVKVAELLTVAYSERDSEKPLLNLAPGDEMQFATVYEVDQTKPYIVEVAVVGKSLGSWKRSQWRASDISLPRVT